MGCIAFSPLAQGLLTDRYLEGIPDDSRAAKPHGFLKEENITPETLEKKRQLNQITKKWEQSLAQMAIAWLLKDERVTSVLVGASSKEQLLDSLQSLNNLNFSKDKLRSIEKTLKK